ncbi:hypothetical protein MJ904_22730 [Massilia sp. MB5]|uniref:hypothetical protein n=1 Tax=Massilia sp. MB5 TaxID=2919578 RepID=UPI001F0D4FCF|nr:hypothetical protein [Massilia sp. MB5]UMR29821.1 hypothetical protein MJ904_22730 [Massilia sp. MB5]
MNPTETPIEPTAFVNVQVVAIPKVDPATGNVTYQTTFHPPAIVVKKRDTVINYQIVSPTPVGVEFFAMTVVPKHTHHQLSEPSVSQSGKLITFSNANTVKEKMNITLHFLDNDKTIFNVDPEIINEPEPAL